MSLTRDGGPPKSFSIAALLLVAVNVPLATVVSVLLLIEYQRQMRQAVDSRQATLQVEASLIGTALLQLGNPNAPATITDYLERSCEGSHDAQMANRWIEAKWQGNRLHSHSGTGPPSKLPRYLAEDGFATAIFLRWEPSRNRIHYASAGHEPMLLLRGQELESFEATGLPLGVDTSLDWETVSISLNPNDRLLLSTDGICEASNSSDQQFGRDRIGQLMKQHRKRSIQQFADTLVERLDEHVGDLIGQDDITLLVMQCDGPCG
ncbi:Phosphoserine phosphatase RsbU [Rubripirellula lacrimiformis]|uniref:Phosphoserine phosphatase RsbU n=1 Tax=Rubripirellula lacrimiformis TaxID=1930273 RepID=A0A517NBQ9_9BACT|nr:PP2C family protein-serine/threonine phosphatase [Rubripirellula lacrimiformis]QDT04576.1 Phosphoserine phosphatase RsbU [Rubripirellula lacrimiformis]